MSTDATLPQPNGGPPVVAMLCTRGMEAFLSNAVHGMLRSGIAPDQILVACPPNAEDSVRRAASHHSPGIRVMAEQSLLPTAAEQYSCFGSASFNEICWGKIALIRQLIERHTHVVYADLDIGWLRNPLPYLSQVASQYPIAFQTEGLPRFPPAVCCGFISLRRSDRTIEFLDALLAQRREGDNGGVNDDQTACQQMIERAPAWLKDIYLLPESLFANGLFYRNLQDSRSAPIAMEGELQPFLFHANWTIGLDNKRKLLAAAGCWFGDDVADLATATDGPGAGPLIAVIYPLFDVRGDVAEHCRHWTGQQQVAPERFQVIAVASADAGFDEAALRRVMRPWDIMVRVDGASQDTELWNAGARAAKTPWLLFVEAHGWPERDALATLAAWIEANPDKSACSFQIKNLDNHPVARLMKRWFAQTQQGWVMPSTWRRVHRTAFALRRTAFEQVGPIGPFGQFGPPLLSARMHRRNIATTTLPTSGLLHDDARDIDVHIHDTADYVRGELAARAAATDPEFFETYFGPSPLHGPRPILPTDCAWSLMRSLLVVAAMRRRFRDLILLRQAMRLLPSAVTGLGLRIALRKARIRIDSFALMKLPLSRQLSWWRFMAQHRDIVAVEQTSWIAHNPLPPITRGESIPAGALTRRAMVGLHALEHLDGAAFRWTWPALLLRLAAGRKVTVTLETRNLRPGLEPSRLAAVVAKGGKAVDIARDDAGNITLRFETPVTSSGVAEIVLVAPELTEPCVAGEPGRRLGLPLFSLTIAFA